MKLTVFLLLAVCLQVSARGYAQNITLSTRSAPLETVLKEIKQQSGFHLVYLKEWMTGTQTVTMDLKNVPLQHALDMCFQNQPLSFTIIENTIVVTPGRKQATPNTTDPEFADTLITVHGQVRDENDKPVPGAVAYIKGSEKAVVADDAGEFTILRIDRNAILVFSSINMERQEVKINGRSSLQVRLQRRTSQLAEVAVEYNTGYQTVTKERATGSFAKPDMKVFAERNSSLDLVARLEGQIPGLYILHDNNGANNKNGSGVTTNGAIIRGTSSIQVSTDPLYVIDGVVATDFSAINLDDIADLTVLKDAAAAAIWGARAANGVIVVTSKKGKNNQKVRVSYSGFVNFSGKPDLNYTKYLTSSQYIQAAQETFNPTTYSWASLSKAFVAPHEQVLYNQYLGPITAAQAEKSLDSLASINNLSQIKDLWYRNALTTNHTVSASGGSGGYNFYTSFNYSNIQSPTPGEKNNTYRFSLNQQFSPGQRFTISLNTSLSDVVAGNLRPISIANAFLPYQLFKDAAGNNISMPYMSGLSENTRLSYQSLSGVNLNYNPLNEMNDGHTHRENLALNISANATVKIWKGISFQGTYGYLTSPGSSTTYDDISEYYMRRALVNFTKAATTPGGKPTYLLPTTGGTFQTNNFNQRNWTVRNQLVYTYANTDGHDVINIQAGQEASDRHSYSYTNTLLGYSEALQTYATLDYNTLKSVSGTVGGRGSIPAQFTAYDGQSRFTSTFALASYTFDHKYSVDLSWRQDKSNLFGSDISSQNKPVWSGGLKWRLTEEKFMKPLSWLNDLGIRATYGITGNSPNVGGSSNFNILGPELNYPIPLIGGYSYRITQAGNDKLSWEATHTINLGMDFALLKNRLSGSIDYYHKNTTSLLGTVPFNPFSGTGNNSGPGNIGNLTNKGIEVSLTSINIQTNKFSWSTRFVFSYNKNKLVSYSAQNPDELDAEDVISPDYSFAGYSLNPLFAFRYAGLDNVGDPQIRLADKTVTKEPEVAFLKDLVYEGSIIPTVTGGLSNNFTYRQFALAINTIYSLGAKMFRPGINNFYTGRLTGASTSFSVGNVPEEFMNRWKKPGDETVTNVPSYTSSSSYNNRNREIGYYTDGDVNVISADYLKISDATLSYTISPAALRSLRMQGANLHVQVGNILLWKNNKYGVDPTVSNIPTNRHNVSVGLNVNF